MQHKKQQLILDILRENATQDEYEICSIYEGRFEAVASHIASKFNTDNVPDIIIMCDRVLNKLFDYYASQMTSNLHDEVVTLINLLHIYKNKS